MKHLTELQFFATGEHNCSYLENVQAKTLFIDPKETVSNEVYSQLSELGFRRSGTHIYRPHCESCHACVSIRIPVATFVMTSSQRRIMNKNKDITITQVTPKFTQEYYSLYEEYICNRHKDGDMYPPSKTQFTSFLVESQQRSHFFEFRLSSGELVAIANMDTLHNSLSAVYTFFDPKYAKRSLGTFAILWQIQEIKKRNLKHLYLGYWVESCQKMKYKTAFRPMELLINGRWITAT